VQEDGGILDSNGRWVKFNGCRLHETQPFQGCRISIIAFTHNACDELKEGTAAELKSLGNDDDDDKGDDDDDEGDDDDAW
jgi:hypothetical protein